MAAFAIAAPLRASAPPPPRHTRPPPSCVLAPRRNPTRTFLSPARAAPSFPPPREPAPPSAAPPSAAPAAPARDLVSETYVLASSPGALGRGVRACLRAFYRRASFILSTARPLPAAPSLLYVEIGPAYVLATARMAASCEKATRYAVEQRAWPALRALFEWEEVSTADARARGAMLRHLRECGRYGRHLFLEYRDLAAIVQVAEDLLQVAEERAESGVAIKDALYDGLVDAGKGAAPWTAVDVEAVVQLRRKPLPGLRTVSAKCPRGEAHSNGDRKPSLMLWMNADGITGGAMCPVCLESGTGAGRQMTWRVHYLPDNSAALCTPQRRIRSPARVQEAIAEYKRTQMGTRQEKGDEDVPSVAEMTDGAKRREGKEGEANGPVGGCVLRNKNRISRVGEVIDMAYVTASLRIATNPSTTGEVSLDGNRLRTVGTMARQTCPMQVLLWSERRSKGPTSSRKVEEVAWFARQSVSLADDGSDAGSRKDGEIVESEEWLPTPLVSVSAMKPSAWRDITSSTGRLISVPAAWEASVQAWVLFDIDDIGRLDKEGVVTKSGNKLALTIRRDQEMSGRCLIMQTGPAGLHVWAELREVRQEPSKWFKKEEARTWYADLGSRLLHACHRAGARRGKVDMSSCSAGRFARRPDWRLLEDGTLFRSHVVVYVPSRVRTRTPRLQ